MLKFTEGLWAQCQILKVLYQREGTHYHIDNESIIHRMEKLITTAGVYKQWSVVRMLSALLTKLVDSLAPSITTVLVRGRHVSYWYLGSTNSDLLPSLSTGKSTRVSKICRPQWGGFPCSCTKWWLIIFHLSLFNLYIKALYYTNITTECFPIRQRPQLCIDLGVTLL